MSDHTNPREAASVTLRSYLAQSEWGAVEEQPRCVFKAHREGEYCPLTYFFQVFPERCQFAFYIVPEIEVPDFKLSETAEYLCRVNSGLRIGNFELDFGNHHVRFKSSLSFEGTELTYALIGAAIEPALKAFEEYFVGLGRVLAGIATPLQAINDVDYAP